MTSDTQIIDSRHLTQVNGDCYRADRYFWQALVVWHAESEEKTPA